MIIVYKFDLILIAIMDKNFNKQNIREEAEKMLEIFYSIYKNEIDKCMDVSLFDSFKNILAQQIKEYFQKVKSAEKSKEIGNFGFFTGAIKKLRETKKS